MSFPWSLREIEALVGSGKLSPERVLKATVDGIDSLERGIQAWSCLAMEPARQRAADLALEFRSTGPRGPLHGVPYGAKDIFDTAGLPTEWGTVTQRGRVPDRDGDLIQELDRLGCVLVGKTRTTAYAYYDTGPTRNPRDPARTPGGSSSGSAAAVAAGMVPLAIGTQTQGSVLRPASFCGIAGFKPSYGCLPLAGVMSFAPSLDHAGVFATDAADIQVAWRALGFATEAESADRITVLDWPPRGAIEPAMRRALEEAVRALAAGGMHVRRTVRPGFFDTLPGALHTVMHGSPPGNTASVIGVTVGPWERNSPRSLMKACGHGRAITDRHSRHSIAQGLRLRNGQWITPW